MQLLFLRENCILTYLQITLMNPNVYFIYNNVGFVQSRTAKILKRLNDAMGGTFFSFSAAQISCRQQKLENCSTFLWYNLKTIHFYLIIIPSIIMTHKAKYGKIRNLNTQTFFFSTSQRNASAEEHHIFTSSLPQHFHKKILNHLGEKKKGYNVICN